MCWVEKEGDVKDDYGTVRSINEVDERTCNGYTDSHERKLIFLLRIQKSAFCDNHVCCGATIELWEAASLFVSLSHLPTQSQ